MSVYSNISKVVGWEPRTIAIPDLITVKMLKKMIIQRHCRISFKRVLEIKRFAPTSKTDDENEAMKIIFQAHEKGTQILNRYQQ